jgi:hypothetical protein
VLRKLKVALVGEGTIAERKAARIERLKTDADYRYQDGRLREQALKELAERDRRKRAGKARSASVASQLSATFPSPPPTEEQIRKQMDRIVEREYGGAA